jgi:hypothetical protein
MEKGVKWWLGDWLNFGERKYGETYSQAIDTTGHSYQALANAKWGGRMPRNPRPDQIGMGGRMLSESLAG